MPAAGTYSRPSYNTGDPVTTAPGCSSILRTQICCPVSASTAYALALLSPKYTAYRFAPDAALYGPTVIADRAAACARNVQYVQPVFASRAYTVPFSLAT